MTGDPELAGMVLKPGSEKVRAEAERAFLKNLFDPACLATMATARQRHYIPAKVTISTLLSKPAPDHRLRRGVQECIRPEEPLP